MSTMRSVIACRQCGELLGSPDAAYCARCGVGQRAEPKARAPQITWYQLPLAVRVATLATLGLSAIGLLRWILILGGI